MVVGRYVTDLVRRHKASVEWRDGESPRNPDLEHQFVGRPKVMLGPKDYLRGAYLRPVTAGADETKAETFRPHVVVGRKDLRRGAQAAWHNVPNKVSTSVSKET